MKSLRYLQLQGLLSSAEGMLVDLILDLQQYHGKTSYWDSRYKWVKTTLELIV
jgi:hypothetical protein